MPRPALILPLVLLALPAFAGPREDTLAGISRCASLPDDRTFLDCIYGAAQPMRGKLGLPPAPAGQVRLVPPAAAYAPAPTTTPMPAYVPPPAPRAAAPRMAAAAPEPAISTFSSIMGNDTSAGWIETYSFDSKGLFTVTFSNGQIWRQDASDTNRAHWNGRASDYSIKFAKDTSGRNGQLMVRGDAGLYQLHRIR